LHLFVDDLIGNENRSSLWMEKDPIFPSLGKTVWNFSNPWKTKHFHTKVF